MHRIKLTLYVIQVIYILIKAQVCHIWKNYQSRNMTFLAVIPIFLWADVPEGIVAHSIYIQPRQGLYARQLVFKLGAREDFIRSVTRSLSATLELYEKETSNK